jgi:hypothetical protein
MSSTKNPEHEAENPAPMERSQQGQSGKKAKMAPQPDAPPGLEQDNHGNAIPFEQRTEEDQKLAQRMRGK